MNPSTNNILVPVDFSDKSMFGVEEAIRIASIFDAELVLLHVIKGVDPIWDIFDEKEQKIYIDRIKNRLCQIVAGLPEGKKCKLTSMVEKGRLCDTILRVAEEKNVMCIVMGTSTADNIKKKIIGTNALRVVSEAKCPVITVKGLHPRKEIKSIVLPLDLSKETKEKVIYAIDFAKACGAKIFVVSMVTINDDGILKRMELQLNQVVKFISKYDLEVTGSIIKCSDRADGLINFTNENQGDMVVITTHQQLEIVSYFIGSFAAEIIHGLNVPVMSIVPKIKHQLIFNLPGTH